MTIGTGLVISGILSLVAVWYAVNKYYKMNEQKVSCANPNCKHHGNGGNCYCDHVHIDGTGHCASFEKV